MNRVVVDPASASYVYVAGDFGVYYTANIANCASNTQNCWSVLGAGLPDAPVTDLQVVHSGTTNVLEASTYGRGIWTIGTHDDGGDAAGRAFPCRLQFSGPGRGDAEHDDGILPAHEPRHRTPDREQHCGCPRGLCRNQ